MGQDLTAESFTHSLRDGGTDGGLNEVSLESVGGGLNDDLGQDSMNQLMTQQHTLQVVGLQSIQTAQEINIGNWKPTFCGEKMLLSVVSLRDSCQSPQMNVYECVV